MCASIVGRAGGFISVESVPDKGATLRVHLPVARAQRDQDAPGRLAKPPRVLIVEDDEPTRALSKD
jgi:hypothetical protein